MRVLVALAITGLLHVPARADEGRLVAVLPLDSSNAKIGAADRVTLEESVRTIAGTTLGPAGYTVLTGDTTLAVLRDNGVDGSRACEASCALEAARELKASLFVSGTVATSEGLHVAFVRLFESGSGRQLSAVQLEGETVRALREQFRGQAADLLAPVLRAAHGPAEGTSKPEPASRPAAGIFARAPATAAPSPARPAATTTEAMAPSTATPSTATASTATPSTATPSTASSSTATPTPTANVPPRRYAHEQPGERSDGSGLRLHAGFGPSLGSRALLSYVPGIAFERRVLRGLGVVAGLGLPIGGFSVSTAVTFGPPQGWFADVAVGWRRTNLVETTRGTNLGTRTTLSLGAVAGWQVLLARHVLLRAGLGLDYVLSTSATALDLNDRTGERTSPTLSNMLLNSLTMSAGYAF